MGGSVLIWVQDDFQYKINIVKIRTAPAKSTHIQIECCTNKSVKNRAKEKMPMIIAMIRACFISSFIFPPLSFHPPQLTLGQPISFHHTSLGTRHLSLSFCPFTFSFRTRHLSPVTCHFLIARSSCCPRLDSASRTFLPRVARFSAGYICPWLRCTS